MQILAQHSEALRQAAQHHKVLRQADYLFQTPEDGRFSFLV